MQRPAATRHERIEQGPVRCTPAFGAARKPEGRAELQLGSIPPPVEARLPPSTGEEPEPGAWIVRAATLILGNERWLHRPAGGGGRGSRSEQADVPGKAANAAASGAPCRAEASGGVVKGQ